MFFWGGYSFQVPQMADLPGKPPLRYPVYVPPPPSLLPPTTEKPHPAGKGADATVSWMHQHRLQVGLLACGQKHVIATIAIVPNDANNNCASDEEAEVKGTAAPAPVYRLYGMGNNEAGQLGPCTPNYATSLVPLRIEERFAYNTTGSSQTEKGTAAPSSILSLACGAHHSLFVSSRGDVYACGDNSVGQLGSPVPHKGGRGHGSGTSSEGDRGRAATTSSSFLMVPLPFPVRAVFAGGNVSYVTDHRGRLYSWGDPQWGQLAHGDSGERVDVVTLKTVIEPVRTPTLVEWFNERHIAIVEVAVGKSHMVCRSAEDVFSVGKGTFGKLGTGNTQDLLLPTRIKFPTSNVSGSKVCSIACGDEHTIVLTENPAVGSVVYFFGKLSNGDGQLTPVALPFPYAAFPSPYHAPFGTDPFTLDASRLVKVFAGRGTQCAAVSAAGTLWVWGKHSNVASVTNGTPAGSIKTAPAVVASLLPFKVEGVAIGASMVVAYASGRKPLPPTTAIKDEQQTWSLSEEAVQLGPAAARASWDLAIPHDDRVGVATGRGNQSVGDPDQHYEEAVHCFLQQYLSDGAAGSRAHSVATAYLHQLPAAPPRTVPVRSNFPRKRTRELQPGDKVRLWMTDVYALGTVADILEQRPAPASHQTPLHPNEQLQNEAMDMDATQPVAGSHGIAHSMVSSAASSLLPAKQLLRRRQSEGRAHLYSDDETLGSANPNRWQPFWFETNEEDGSCIAPTRKDR
eukprot:gene8120-5656_t